MATSPVPDEAAARLRVALGSAPPLLLAVVFGSRATGRATPESDWDLGILPVDAEVALRDELSLAAALESAMGAEVDVVRLDRDDPILLREVARTGVLLFESAPGTFAAFRARAIGNWLDFEETIAPHRARFLRRIAGGGP